MTATVPTTIKFEDDNEKLDKIENTSTELSDDEHSMDEEDSMDEEEQNTFYGVAVRPLDPLDLSFHSHTSRNPLDVSYHKQFIGKSILKAKSEEIVEGNNVTDVENEKIHEKTETEDKVTFASAKSSSKNTDRRVLWHVLHVREYDITIGDNPCVSYGPPISLDWCYLNLGTVDVETYENHRQPRRAMREMLMNYYYRKNLLIYTCGEEKALEDIKRVGRALRKTKTNRAITNAIPTPVRLLEEMAQTVIRKTKRKLAKRNKEVVIDI